MLRILFILIVVSFSTPIYAQYILGEKSDGGYIFWVSPDGSEALIAAEQDLVGKKNHGEAIAAMDNGWQFASADQVRWMYENLHKEGKGDFKAERYWTSRSVSAGYRESIDFSDGVSKNGFVADKFYVRPYKKISMPNRQDLFATGTTTTRL